MPAHLISHLAVMADLHAQGRYDRMTDDLFKLTGKTPTSMHRLRQTSFCRFVVNVSDDLQEATSMGLN